MIISPVVTVTDELLEELERYPELAFEVEVMALLNHIRTLQQELKAAHISVDNCELFRKDAERLDWMIEEGCVIYSMNGTASPTVYQVTWPRLGEHQREWYPSPREAIDAAMTAAEIGLKVGL